MLFYTRCGQSPSHQVTTFFIVVKATNVFLLYFKLLLQDVTGRADGHRLALKLARAKLDAGLQVFCTAFFSTGASD